MNILSAIGYNTQSNLKTAAGCGTEREQRHSTGGILKWQKIMKMRTKQATTVLTRQLQKMRWTARTAAKMLPEILQKMRPAIRHLTHMTQNRMTIPTDTKAKTSGKFSPFFLCKK